MFPANSVSVRVCAATALVKCRGNIALPGQAGQWREKSEGFWGRGLVVNMARRGQAPPWPVPSPFAVTTLLRRRSAVADQRGTMFITRNALTHPTFFATIVLVTVESACGGFPFRRCAFRYLTELDWITGQTDCRRRGSPGMLLRVVSPSPQRRSS